MKEARARVDGCPQGNVSGHVALCAPLLRISSRSENVYPALHLQIPQELCTGQPSPEGVTRFDASFLRLFLYVPEVFLHLPRLPAGFANFFP